MLIILKVKNTNNIIGLKEDITAKLEEVADVERIDVYDDGDIVIQAKMKEKKERKTE